MRLVLSRALACAMWLASGLPMLAHHSGAAEFDSTKKIDLTGTVTKVEWTNPHAHFYMDVKDPSGNVANWNLELASPNVLIRNGWKRNSIKPGDTVSVTGIRAKDSPTIGSAGVITFPDGHKLTFLSGEEPAK
jgi:Family of unknown function (DUF6152)